MRDVELDDRWFKQALQIALARRSQRQLAKDIACSPSYITKLLQGQVPDVRLLVNLVALDKALMNPITRYLEQDDSDVVVEVA